MGSRRADSVRGLHMASWIAPRTVIATSAKNGVTNHVSERSH